MAAGVLMFASDDSITDFPSGVRCGHSAKHTERGACNHQCVMRSCDYFRHLRLCVYDSTWPAHIRLALRIIQSVGIEGNGAGGRRPVGARARDPVLRTIPRSIAKAFAPKRSYKNHYQLFAETTTARWENADLCAKSVLRINQHFAHVK